MLRIDVNYGGITGCWKLINLCQLYGVQCEIHGVGAPHVHLAAATPEALAAITNAASCGLGAITTRALRISIRLSIPWTTKDGVHVSQEPDWG